MLSVTVSGVLQPFKAIVPTNRWHDDLDNAIGLAHRRCGELVRVANVGGLRRLPGKAAAPLPVAEDGDGEHTEGQTNDEGDGVRHGGGTRVRGRCNKYSLVIVFPELDAVVKGVGVDVLEKAGGGGGGELEAAEGAVAGTGVVAGVVVFGVSPVSEKVSERVTVVVNDVARVQEASFQHGAGEDERRGAEHGTEDSETIHHSLKRGRVYACDGSFPFSVFRFPFSVYRGVTAPFYAPTNVFKLCGGSNGRGGTHVGDRRRRLPAPTGAPSVRTTRTSS